MSKEYQMVIGLEVHVHLKTLSKLFCRCKNLFSDKPNTHICPVCTGQPGVLPVVNKEAIRQAVKASLALNCRVNDSSIFARKQYFYPDLPKNYQISQYEHPLAIGGEVNINGKEIPLTRVHLEEDAGRLLHTGEISLVDFNRCGMPLLEIVSEPNITSPKEASIYLKQLRQILRYCGVSNCDMEKGSLRCDANISLKEQDSDSLGVKTEIKNLNSFKAVEKSLEYEDKRQRKLLEAGERVVQETRLWDENKNITISMRSKEEANDYRYFPEPDLPPMIIDKEWVDEIKKRLPEFPKDKRERYIRDYKLSDYDADVLTYEKEVADYFEAAVECVQEISSGKIKKLVNWITVELLGLVNAESVDFSVQPVEPSHIAELVNLIEDGTISGKMAKDIFKIMWETKKLPSQIISESGMKQITSDDKIEDICKKVINDNPQIVEKYLSGKETVIGALVGNVMKETRGQANPRLVNEKLKQLIGVR